jgi:hypothetical protein
VEKSTRGSNEGAVRRGSKPFESRTAREDWWNVLFSSLIICGDLATSLNFKHGAVRASQKLTIGRYRHHGRRSSSAEKGKIDEHE